MQKIYDTIIVGGGPAGLSCALILGRCRRKVLVFDTGKQRNHVSSAMFGFPSRDGEHPLVFLNTVKEELSKYGIRIRKKEISVVTPGRKTIQVKATTGETFMCRKLLLATGLTDKLPPINGVEKYYGKGVFHCPYCDGWEVRDGHWFLCAQSAKAAVEVSLRLKTWTRHVTLLSAYTKGLTATQLKQLQRNGITVLNKKVKELKGTKTRLESVILEDGIKLRCDAFFFSAPSSQHCGLAENLGCELTRAGTVNVSSHQKTNIPGIFVAGDMARDMQLVLIAAAEGAKAAVVINAELNKEDRLA